MICCQFIFRPGAYDDDFHVLDDDIAAYARSLPGFVRSETWQSHDGTIVNAVYFFDDRDSMRALARYPQHRRAKAESGRWYEAHRVIVSEVTAEYGDAELSPG